MKQFEQIVISTGKVIDHFKIDDLHGDYREITSKLQVGDGVQFTGQTKLVRVN